MKRLFAVAVVVVLALAARRAGRQQPAPAAACAAGPNTLDRRSRAQRRGVQRQAHDDRDRPGHARRRDRARSSTDGTNVSSVKSPT